MNKIITLGDIFENIETEEKAFKFIKYIKDLQKENKLLRIHLNVMKEDSDNTQDRIERLNNIIKEARECVKRYDTIRGYYEYEELVFYEYNYDENVKQELLNIIDKGSDKNDK